MAVITFKPNAHNNVEMTEEINPIHLFNNWFQEEKSLSKAKIPTAVCMSTMGTDNFPNARFVSLKELVDDAFVVTGPLNSRKGIEIEQNKNVALTFWWTETERQVRVQGIADKIPVQLADKYFQSRSQASKAVSVVCAQGTEAENIARLESQVLKKVTENTSLERPKDWSGFLIKPVRIEFMQFKTSRFHERKLFEFKDNMWTLKLIQP